MNTLPLWMANLIRGTTLDVGEKLKQLVTDICEVVDQSTLTWRLMPAPLLPLDAFSLMERREGLGHAVVE